MRVLLIEDDSATAQSIELLETVWGQGFVLRDRKTTELAASTRLAGAR